MRNPPLRPASCLLRVSALGHLLVFTSWYDSTKLARIETSCSEIGRIRNQLFVRKYIGIYHLCTTVNICTRIICVQSVLNMNKQSVVPFIKEESHEIIVKENEEEKQELKRKRNCERQRAYYHRQKDLKKNEKKRKKPPKTNAERQREFRQRQAEKSYMDIFPRDPIIKEKWINATGRGPNWFPTKNSSVCSDHFEPACKQPHKNARRLFDQSVPTLKLRTVVINYVQPSTSNVHSVWDGINETKPNLTSIDTSVNTSFPEFPEISIVKTETLDEEPSTSTVGDDLRTSIDTSVNTSFPDISIVKTETLDEEPSTSTAGDDLKDPLLRYCPSPSGLSDIGSDELENALDTPLVTQLKLQLKEIKKQLKLKDQQLRAKDQQLKAKDQQLKAKDQQLKAKDVEINSVIDANNRLKVKYTNVKLILAKMKKKFVVISRGSEKNKSSENNTYKDEPDSLKNANDAIKDEFATLNDPNDSNKDRSATSNDPNDSNKVKFATLNDPNDTNVGKSASSNDANDSNKDKSATSNDPNASNNDQFATLNDPNDINKDNSTTLNDTYKIKYELSSSDDDMDVD